MTALVGRLKSEPFWVLGFFLTALAFLVWRPLPGGLWHDDGVYLLVGKALAGGEGLVYTGVPGSLPAAKFPPIYSGLLALFWLVFRTIEPVVAAAQITNLLLAVAAGVVFARFLHRLVGLTPWTAVGTTVLGWLCVELWQFSMVPLSEAAFLLVWSLYLIVATNAEREKSGARLASLAALTGLLVLTRSIGLAVALGAVVALSSLRRFREAGAVVAGMTVLLPWMIWSRQATASIPGPLRDILGSYTSWWIERVRADLPAFLARVPEAAVGNAEAVLRMMFPGVPLEIRWVLGTGVLALIVFGAPLLFRRSRTAAFALLFYFLLLCAWPFQDRRLVMPAMPLLIATSMLPVVQLGRRASTREPGAGLSWPARAALAYAVSWMAFYGAVSGYGLARGWARAGHDLRRDALAVAVQAVEREGSDEVVGAPELWAAIHLYSGRQVAPSAPFRPGTEGRISGDPADQWAVWSAGGVQHLLAEHGGVVHGEAIDSLEGRCPGVINMVAQSPSSMLFDLGSDDPCVSRELRQAAGR